MSGSLTRMKSLVTSYPVIEGSFLHDAFSPVAVEIDTLTDDTLPAALDAHMPDTALAADLDRVAAAYGVTRKAAAAAVGEVTFTGTPDSIIAKSVPVSTPAGFVFLTDEQVTIPAGGSITVGVTAALAGIRGNVSIGTVTMIPIALAGVDSVTNSAAMAGGADIESDAAYRDRLFIKIRLPSASGVESDYERWAREVQGVEDARCVPIWDGPGTVKVIIAGAGMQPVDTETLERCEDYIEAARPIGAQVTVASVEGVAVTVAANVDLATGYTLSAVTAAFSAAAQSHFEEQALSSSYLSYARMGALLLSVDGVLDYTGLLLNGAASNVALTDEQVPTLGTVTLT